LDSVKTPFGETREALGGSATFACYARVFFAPDAHGGGVRTLSKRSNIAKLLEKSAGSVTPEDRT